MADSPAPVTWRGKVLADLTEEELLEAYDFLDKSYEEFHAWAPIHVWAFISSVRADITIEVAKRARKKEQGNGVRG